MTTTLSSPTVAEVITHPFRGRVVLAATPAIDDRDAPGWWAWVQANALPPEDPGYAKEQAWLDKARAHWPGRPDADGYTEAFERDRLCAELMSTDITEPPDVPSMDTETGDLVWVRHLRPSMQDALVRGLLTEGVVGSSDLCVTLASAPNVALVKRLLTDDAIAFLRHEDRHLERAAPGQDRVARDAQAWRPVWPGALNEVAEQHLWSNVEAKIDLLLEMGWALEGERWERTPLSAAVVHDNLGAVDALLRRGADPLHRPMVKSLGPSSTPEPGTSAWAQALTGWSGDALRRFLAHGVVPDAAALERAVTSGSRDALATLLAHGVDPFPPDEAIRPGRLPRLLRLAAMEVRREIREGFTAESGFTVNRRRLEQIWLNRAAEATATTTGRARQRL